ncbi:TPA: MCE family protein [Escherichia coli]|nr:MCE family protein [Escherichia coli]
MSQETPASTTEAQIKNKRRISPFWLLPFIALMIAGWLIWDSYQDRGNTVTIDFMSADGIVPGRTPVRYQGVEVGTVQDISLSDDLRKIEVKVSIKSDMKDALREETQFWLVTPKASLAGVSGLDALVGGNYIGMMPGKGKEQDHFVALDTQPKYRLDNGDLMIHLQAPDLGSLSSGSLVYFRKIPVGKVYDYAINPNKQGVVIDVLIERRFTDLVKKGSRFWNVSGVDANVSISGAKVKLESLAALVNGAIAFDSPEESKPAEAEDTFGLYEDLAHSQRGVIIKLELPGGAGLTADSTPLMYQGLEVGQLTKLDLNPGGKVTGEMTVDPSVVTLLRENTRIELRNPKLSLSDANLSALLTGKTFELVPGDGEPRKEFVVVPGEKALLQEPDVLTLTLTAPESYGIDAGQPLILHGVQVGQVIDRKLTSKGVTFTVAIEPQHRELVKGDSKFVVNSRVDVKVGLDGVEFLGASASQRKGDKRILYASETAARAVGGQITLHAFDAGKLAVGMPIRYLGIDIGQIQTLDLITARNEVQAKAVLYPEYVQTFARGGTRFSVVTPQISAAGVEHLDTILQPYINVEPGRGNPRRDFELQEATITDSRYLDGLSIIVEAPEAGSLGIGTPVLFRGLEVGTVTGMTLGTLSDRVMIAMRISKRYQHLVRNNSVFWLASGYSLDFGLTGGVVKTGTFNQFIRGGIAFATPPGTPLAPKAQEGKHFLLQESEPKEWREWGTALPK